MKPIATVILAAILSAAAFPSFSQSTSGGLKKTSSGLKETAPAGGEGSGDVSAVNITMSSPLTGTASCASGTCAFTLGLGTVPATKGGTGLTTFTLGDILYSSAANTLSKLAGNTTTTRKLLAQTGDGVDSAAPSWVPIYDIPCDLGEEECVFQSAAGFALSLNSDLLYLGTEAGTSIFGVTPAGAHTHVKARLMSDAKEQRDITTLASTGTFLGTNILCSTGAGAVVGTLDADAATDGRFVYVTRSGANTCTVAVESGHTLDGVTDGTAVLADGASRTLKQTGSTAWVTVDSWPIAAADVPTLNQSTTGNAATATALAANPADCSAGQYASSINASGTLGCAQVAYSQVSSTPVIGTDTQAYDADLGLLAAVSPTTKGDILVFNGSAWVRLGVGTDTHVLTADSAEASGTKWAAATGGGISGLNATKIPVATGATAIADSVITHNSTTGVTSIAGTGPSLRITDDNLTTTSTDALVLQNTTAATVGVTAQYSPRLRFVGSGWKTNATAAAQSTEWLVEQVPFSRATAPANSLGFVPVRNGVVSSTPLWMCQMAETGAGTFGSGLIFAGTYGRCDNSVGYVGLASAGSNTLGVWNNATLTTTFATTGVGVGSSGTLFFTSSAMALNTTTGDLTLSRGAAATLQLGAAAAASPVAQTLQAQGSRSGTDSNVGGGNLTIQPGAGTGTGTPSSLILNAPVGAASGTGAHTQTAALTIKGAANGALPEVILNGTSSPASGAACTTGAITWDASYIYVCTASGAWKRAALTGGY